MSTANQSRTTTIHRMQKSTLKKGMSTSTSARHAGPPPPTEPCVLTEHATQQSRRRQVLPKQAGDLNISKIYLPKLRKAVTPQFSLSNRNTAKRRRRKSPTSPPAAEPADAVPTLPSAVHVSWSAAIGAMETSADIEGNPVSDYWEYINENTCDSDATTPLLHCNLSVGANGKRNHDERQPTLLDPAKDFPTITHSTDKLTSDQPLGKDTALQADPSTSRSILWSSKDGHCRPSLTVSFTGGPPFVSIPHKPTSSKSVSIVEQTTSNEATSNSEGVDDFPTPGPVLRDPLTVSYRVPAPRSRYIFPTRTRHDDLRPHIGGCYTSSGGDKVSSPRVFSWQPPAPPRNVRKPGGAG